MLLPSSLSRALADCPKRTVALVAALLTALLMPAASFAAGAEANIKLEFSASDKIYLFVSLGFGFIALLVGFMIMKQVLAQDKGDSKMQEVGGAIYKGAMAYLKQQFSMMSIFVVILAIGLFFMYRNDFGPSIAVLTSVAMVGGVLASYFAGYVGMYMAVNANTRTAAAALTSYKNSLETAFRSGAVAGLFTVGMGLIGATLIFLLAGENATKLLIGFGFGGSLAALFMRVGGGIFTKAADVGADLVGKVEAGIPEDDPRNPAVIADNVGDNVGDCAGMAADVFESYEVTLVAAIVLGAATAAIFPQETWVKLILFAMMARGVGILASIFGIYFVKGSDDITHDPLKSIRKGFYGSAAIALVATFGLAAFMLGGFDPSSAIVTNRLVAPNAELRERTLEIKSIQREIAAQEGVLAYTVTADQIKESTRFEAMDIEDAEADLAIQQAISTPDSAIPAEVDYRDYREVDFTNEDLPLNSFAMPDPAGPAEGVDPNSAQGNPMISIGEAYSRGEYGIYVLRVPQPPMPGQEEPSPEPTFQTIYYGPILKESLDKQIEQSNSQSPDQPGIAIESRIPVMFFVNKEDNVVIGVEEEHREALTQNNFQPAQFGFKDSPEAMTEIITELASNPAQQPPLPEQIAVEMAYLEHKTIEWWRFAVCVAFGLLMAFVFEWLTDYYVGLHKRPVQEVGQVATAGPAPMIISGFAYGKESSVFSVFAIVACLIAPLIIFPPGQFGGYLLSFYGIALVGLGLLTTTGFILAMDTFGPISDNSQGVFEMSGAHHDNPDGARRVQLLDAAGNTTKALTKGFAIATAVVAAVALFHAYVEEGQLVDAGMRLEIPEIFLGLLIGGAAPYLFSAFSIQAVGRAAFQLINEVRRQFREDPGIMAGTSTPDYGRCVAISTRAAQKELIGPGLLAIGFPILIGFGFAIGKPNVVIAGAEYNLVGAQALGGFLAGTILSGQLMAVLLANSGGMWDNAKKLIEDGLHGGKGTEAHKAAVVCDTVGDPFKDTAGPALNPLIKVMNLVALLIAPQVIAPREDGVLILITGVAAAAIIVAIVLSKSGSLAGEMEAAVAIPGSTSGESETPIGTHVPGPEDVPDSKELAEEVHELEEEEHEAKKKDDE